MKDRINGWKKNIGAVLAGVMMLCLFTPSQSSAAGDDQTKLRLALLPIPDVLPVFVAIQQGYFKEAGIRVETLQVGSAVERDQLMQANRIDGMINEISGAALFNRQEVRMQIVSYARIPKDDGPLFRILAAPDSGLTKLSELAGVPIGISKNTIIEYITERLLQNSGLSGDQIVGQSVPVLPERLQLLLAGQIQAATLPDPLGYSAIEAGAVELVNDLAIAERSGSVISFSSDALTTKTESVKKFMVAWDKAAAELNADPDGYRALMLAKIRVPKNVQSSFTIPPFPRKMIPSEEQWDDVQEWMIEKKLLKKAGRYSDSVNPDFLAR